MKKRKILILVVLTIFVIGMTMSSVSASHTFKLGKYKGKLSDKKYKQLKNANKKGKYKRFVVKTGKYKTHKIPKYKKKKVTKYKWKYKTVLETKSVYNSDFSECTDYDYDVDKYFDNGWTYYGYKTVEENDGHIYKFYAKFKKKVKYTTTKKVKVGIKKVKAPVYMEILSCEDGKGWIELSVYDKYDSCIAIKEIDI